MVPLLLVYAQGVGSAGADDLNTLVRTADTVAQVRTFTGVGSMKLLLSGFTATNDGGQGTFEWIATSTEADDGGTTCIQPTGGANQGRWIRIFDSAPAIAPNAIELSQIALAPPDTVVANNTGAPGNLTFVAIADLLAGLPTATTTLTGVVKLATDLEAIAGLNSSDAIVPSSLAAVLTVAVPALVNAALEADFWQSGQITIAAGASGFLPHTLGAKPLRVAGVFICTLATNQYLVGDEIPAPLPGVQVWTQNNANTVGYAFAASGPTILSATGSPFSVTSTNFVLVVRAWLV